MRYLLGFAFLFIAQPALADWQFTHWGMTLEQVARDSNGKASIVAPKATSAGTIFNVGPYTSGDHQFEASYTFKDRRLSSISLETHTPCQGLHDDLKVVYGKPLESSSVNLFANLSKWIDVKKNNAITLIDFGDSCTLIYAELKVANRSGL